MVAVDTKNLNDDFDYFSYAGNDPLARFLTMSQKKHFLSSLCTLREVPWWKSFKDLQGSLRILMRIFVRIFIKIFKDPGQDFQRSSRIFKDLKLSCQDLQGSCQRSWRILKDPEGSWQDLDRILTRSFARSSKILPRSWRIFKVLVKILKELW